MKKMVISFVASLLLLGVLDTAYSQLLFPTPQPTYNVNVTHYENPYVAVQRQVNETSKQIQYNLQKMSDDKMYREEQERQREHERKMENLRQGKGYY